WPATRHGGGLRCRDPVVHGPIYRDHERPRRGAPAPRNRGEFALPDRGWTARRATSPQYNRNIRTMAQTRSERPSPVNAPPLATFFPLGCNRRRDWSSLPWQIANLQ